ncbi:MAG TPA: PilZ domain-containing protein [Anaeromyxobacter sp.]
MSRGNTPLHSVSVQLEPTQFLAGWREKTGTLFLPTLSDTRVGDEVAVRIGIYGHAIRATLFGKVSLVRRMGRPALLPGVELHLERHSLAAAGFLAAAARGEPVTFKEREPRWSVERPLQIERGRVGLEATTINVSEGGCALRWPGQLPLVGDTLTIRLKDGFFNRSLRAVVCWNQPGAERDRSVGVKVVPEGRAGRAWRTLVEAVSRSGARGA